MQLVCLQDGVAYMLIASNIAGEPFEACRDEFRSMLLSFQLTEISAMS
jgi:hypothetical protein